MRYAGEKKLNTWVIMVLRTPALFLLFVVHPLVLMLYKNVFTEEGKLSFSYLTKFSARKYYRSTLMNSFKVTIVSALVAALLGLIMAYILRSVKIRGGRCLNILIAISYLSPPFTGVYMWIQLLGRNGFIIKVLSSLFQVELGGIYSLASIVLVFLLQSFPLVYMYISGALKNLDNFLNEAAESLECTAFQRVIRVIIPLVMPTILANSLLVFMGVLSSFGTPTFIGEGHKTFPVPVYSQFTGEVSMDDHFAAALRVIVIVITLVLFFFQCCSRNRFIYSMTALKPIETGHCTETKNILPYLSAYVVVPMAVLSQLTVIFTSFLTTGGGAVHTGGFSLGSYRNTLSSRNNSGAIFNTYLFDLYTIATVVVLGTPISYLTVRKKSFLTGVLDIMTMFSYIIPGSVFGISFLYAFDSRPVLLSDTAIIIIVSLSTRRISYTIRSSTIIVGQIGPSVEEAAISLGCTGTKFLVKITVPMMMSGVLSGVIMGWATLINELGSSTTLYTNRTRILTMVIYVEVIRSSFGNAAAYSAILTLTNIVSLLMFSKVTGSNDISI